MAHSRFKLEALDGVLREPGEEDFIELLNKRFTHAEFGKASHIADLEDDESGEDGVTADNPNKDN